ncbi:hypothetical protein LTR64_004462 [Lithohypha guttulata]|uniref:Uncharacterized protein n=1 Tax=Lithohypha guttulata TaxID=1690604 RepID=A0AAN7T2T4_9EURO|nr:hypothetical protein LTR51_006242 [Lithohypha guttulata]KAK5088446.1 hypothetical protein LTR05_002664 [Lithohypha guttulata]
MAQIIPPPDTYSLLPPLLACLPTSFASSKPPPSLLELLSPILRQRLQIHTTSSSAHDSWLRLLCWDSSKAERLKEIVENANFEPHPASGELEIGEIERLCYKRFDPETLKAQVPLNDWDLTALYLWCLGSEEGNNWKLAELIPYDSDLSSDQTWSASLNEAEQKALLESLAVQPPRVNGDNKSLSVPVQEEDGDDDYWAQYDNTPGRTPGPQTPARKQSVNPQGSANSDADYYARYGSVQPAMDSYDPDEQHEEMGESTLNGNSMQHTLNGDSYSEPEPIEETRSQQFQDLSKLQIPEEDERAVEINHPMPSSPSSRAGSDTIARLEETADRYSASEIAIKQHISYSVKSMYRLAKGAGLSRGDFEDMIQRELETLSLLDRE